MSPWVIGLSYAWFLSVGFSWWMYFKHPTKYDDIAFYLEPFQCVLAFLVAAISLAHDDYITCGIYMFNLLLSGWFWWHKHKRRRKKLLEKTSERIVDAGGRLKIVRGPEGNPT